jgi:hypothetical protein
LNPEPEHSANAAERALAILAEYIDDAVLVEYIEDRAMCESALDRIVAAVQRA